MDEIIVKAPAKRKTTKASAEPTSQPFECGVVYTVTHQDGREYTLNESGLKEFADSNSIDHNALLICAEKPWTSNQGYTVIKS